MLNPYKSAAQCQAVHGIIFPKPYNWFLLQPAMLGEVNGLPGSRGLAVASNGIIVLIERGNDLFFGHMDHFVEDKLEQVSPKPAVKKTRATRTAKTIPTEYLDYV